MIVQIGQRWRDRAGGLWVVQMPHRAEGCAELAGYGQRRCRRSVSFEELGRDFRLEVTR